MGYLSIYLSTTMKPHKYIISIYYYYYRSQQHDFVTINCLVIRLLPIAPILRQNHRSPHAVSTNFCVNHGDDGEHNSMYVWQVVTSNPLCFHLTLLPFTIFHLKTTLNCCQNTHINKHGVLGVCIYLKYDVYTVL